MSSNQLDNWDRHWTDFQRAAEIAPSVRWRRRILSQLLAIEGSGEGARVLEIGSGPGYFAEQFAAEHPRAAFLGLDLSFNAVRLAAAKVPPAEFRQRDLLQPATGADDLSFGATHAICSEVLEHADKPEVLLRNSLPYMSRGCSLVVTVPGGPISAFHKHIGHRRHYTAESLTELLTRAGFQVDWASGVGFPFFNLYAGLLFLGGEEAIAEVSKEPGPVVRAAGNVFDFLFRMNSMRAGWQIAAVARLRNTEPFPPECHIDR
jgi:2-polyprenyl-3-methyl-5-hydroxy-6-metoxy-1,4-benzoquinol methylase